MSRFRNLRHRLRSVGCALRSEGGALAVYGPPIATVSKPVRARYPAANLDEVEEILRGKPWLRGSMKRG